MRRLARHRPSPAMIVAVIALFVSLSGASYAALKFNSVGPKQIRKNAVRSPKVKDNTLQGIDLRDGTVALVDMGSNSVDGSKVVDGSLTGADVKAGTFLGGTITVQRVDKELPDGGSVGIEAACPAGATVIGGGATVAASSGNDIHLTVSRPFKAGGPNNGLPESGEGFDGWRVVYVNVAAETGATTARAFAICAQVP